MMPPRDGRRPAPRPRPDRAGAPARATLAAVRRRTAGAAVVVGLLLALAAGCSGDDDDDADDGAGAEPTTTTTVAAATTTTGATSTDPATTTTGGETTTTVGGETTTTSGGTPTPTTIVASGVTETRDFPLADFTGVDVSSFEVTITRADAFAVSVTADDNVFDRLVVEVREGVLHLGLVEGTTIEDATELSATVGMPELTSLDGSGGAILTAGGFQTDVDRDVELSGASQLTSELRAAELSLDVSGGGLATLSGTAASLEVDGSGGAIVAATDLQVVDAELELSGGSQADLTVTGRIDADLSGGSAVRYAGGATQGEVETSGGSTIDAI
jgi:hypothetical protein